MWMVWGHSIHTKRVCRTIVVARLRCVKYTWNVLGSGCLRSERLTQDLDINEINEMMGAQDACPCKEEGGSPFYEHIPT